MTAGDWKAGATHYMIVAFTCSVVACLVTLWAVNPSGRDSIPQSSGMDADLLMNRLDDLSQKVDSLTQGVANLRKAPRIAREPVTGGDPLAEEVSTILDRLNELPDIVDRLEKLQAILGSRGMAQDPVDRDVPIKWGELDALSLLQASKYEAASRTVWLLTPPEVIAQFGFPTMVAAAAPNQRCDFTWSYYRYGSDGKPDGHAMFMFKSGYVVNHEIHLPIR